MSIITKCCSFWQSQVCKAYTASCDRWTASRRVWLWWVAGCATVQSWHSWAPSAWGSCRCWSAAAWSWRPSRSGAPSHVAATHAPFLAPIQCLAHVSGIRHRFVLWVSWMEPRDEPAKPFDFISQA